ncbi:MAG TPA: M13 family metallopeptidase [Oleiagrimonas sp.]|nr:M13 family metallopeptidase [Oleiagrimonas sp.]
MNKHLFKPIALAVALALGVGNAYAATDNFDMSELSKTISPCTDFNGYVNSQWIESNPIPADQTSWGAFNMLAEKSRDEQHQILESAAKNAAHAKPGTIEQKLGWYYASGMNEAAINKAGFDPIKPKLAEIAALKNSADVVNFLDASFNEGMSYVFSFGSGADFKDATNQIGFAFQDGLGLPTRDYYFDAKYKHIRDAYVAYIAKTLQMTGASAADAKKQADQVMAFETQLAKASLAPTELRNLDNDYHFVSVAGADKVTPHFSWDKFFQTQGINAGKGFSLSQPKFFAEMDKLIATAPVAQWQAYLRFHTIDMASPVLSDAFQTNHFDFHNKTLAGQPQQKPRWKRVLREVNEGMGMGLGELYVAKYFPPQSKARAEQLVTNVRDALRNRIEHLDWMSPETKAKAIEKWKLFLPKIGYPDPGEWRDWSGLTIVPDNYFANAIAAAKYNYHYDIGKIGKKTDRKEWGMTPQTVNAYYSPTTNTINFPAAILQPPFFYANGDDGINYGGIGAVIGHESSHGFDDQGSQFDGNGNRQNWWTKQDQAKFKARTGKLVKQFDAYTPLPGVHVNGQLTLGENIGDLGGLNAAYDALQTALKDNPKEANAKIDGMTEDQRFFLNWARVWRENMRPQMVKLLVSANPHAPAQFRAIGAPSNMPQFAQAFQCKAGDKMVRSGDKRVKIW